VNLCWPPVYTCRERITHTCTHHTKGVHSFVWCHAYSCFASCGLERDVTVWHVRDSPSTQPGGSWAWLHESCIRVSCSTRGKLHHVALVQMKSAHARTCSRLSYGRLIGECMHMFGVAGHLRA
jgi:hypothetical protein